MSDPTLSQPEDRLSETDSGSHHYHSHHRHHHRRCLYKIWQHFGPARIFFFVLLPVILISGYFILLISTTLTSTRGYLEMGQWHLQRGLNQITDKPFQELTLADFEQLHSDLTRAEEAFEQARTIFQPLTPFAIGLGGDARAVPAMIEIAIQTTAAGHDLYDGALPLFNQLLFEKDSPGLSTSSTIYNRLLPPLLAGQPKFAEARSHLAAAIESSRQIEPGALSDSIALDFQKVQGPLVQAGTLVDILAQAPDLLDELLGSQGRKVYLVMAQNNDELRPTGGFVGTYGVLVLENGQVIASEYHSTRPPNLQPPDAPCPVVTPAWWMELQAPVWACWDAQWTADFPTLARQAQWFYEHGNNHYPKVDGVLALDLLGMEKLLAAIGPVTIPEYNELISAENMRAKIYAYRGQGGEEPHKKFLEALFKTMLNHLPELPARQAPAAVSAVWGAISEKHLLLYSAQPDLQILLTTLNASGDLRQVPGDYLYVVDSSLTTKGYSAIQETIEYAINLNADGSATGHVTLNWSFPSAALTQDPALVQAGQNVADYKPVFINFARVYVPEGSLWSGSDGNESPTQFAREGQKQMFGNRVDLAPGQSKQIRVHYLSAPLIQKEGTRSIYRLTIQKQPGTRGHALMVRVTLPDGAQMIESSPAPSAEYRLAQDVVEFKIRLDGDRQIVLVYR